MTELTEVDINRLMQAVSFTMNIMLLQPNTDRETMLILHELLAKLESIKKEKQS